MQATTTYFIQNNQSLLENPTFNVTLRTEFGVATLVDNDLIRGDDFGEAVTLGIGQAPGGGPRPFFNGGEREVLTSLTFDDGTTLTGVKGLFSSNIIYGVGDYFFLFETAALASVGKTVTDVARVDGFTFTDHNLNWSDLGFSGEPVPPAPPPPPPPPPPIEGLNRIEGTARNDVLVGTAGDDLIIAHGGRRDLLTGGAGEDTFVFGAQARNGKRDTAVITDYDALEDSILLVNGARVASYVEGRNKVTITLAGADGDRIILEDVSDRGPLFTIETAPPDFLV